VPTVPRLEGRKVLAEPMPGARVSVSADEETFGGGASSKAIVAATEQLNTTLQNKMARQKALNASLQTNKLLSLAEQEAFNAHYDKNDKEFEEIDPVTQKPIKKVAPGGILLASGEQASYGGGAGKRSLAVTMEIADKYFSQLSPEEADRFVLRFSKTAQTLNDRSNALEVAQRKAYYDKETESRLSQVASKSVLPLDERIAEIKSTAYKNGALAGDPKSDADEKIGKAVYEAYESDLLDQFNTRFPNEKAITKLMRSAEEDKDLSSVYRSAFKSKAETMVAKKLVDQKEEKIKNEADAITTELGPENEWKIAWDPRAKNSFFGLHLKNELSKKKFKEIPTSIYEDEFERRVTSCNAKSAERALAKTDDATYTDLMMKVFAPGYPVEKYNLDHITAADELKLSDKDYNKLGNMYAMDPKQKYYASQGLVSLGALADDNNISPDKRRFIFEKYLEVVPKINEKSYPQHQAERDVLAAHGKTARILKAGVSPDDAYNASAKIHAGNKVNIQNTGLSPAKSGPAQVNLSAPKVPDSKYKDHPRYAQAVAALKKVGKKVSDKNLKVVLQVD
jgi:hypothetical protein